MRALIINGEKQIEEHISLAIKTGWPGSKLITAHSAGEGIDAVETQSPDMVVIDYRPPDIDGYDVLESIRLFSDVPIIMISNKLDEYSIVKGFELGADDYVSRKFGELELIYRMKAILKRLHPRGEESPLIRDKFCLYPSTAELLFDHKKIFLTRIESIIMGKLMRNMNNVVTHACLADAIWGDNSSYYKSSIKTHISHIRVKLESNNVTPEVIKAKPGLGYILREHT
jgi:two-component system KDP operon response regulator KdpE